MEQQQSNLNQQMKVLWQYKWWIVLVAIVAGVTSLVLTSIRPPVYEATAKLMAGSGQQRLAAIPSGIQGVLEMTYLQDIGSQIEVMRSRAVLEQAITQLEPEKADDENALQQEVQKLEASLSINQVDATNLVTITVVSTDPLLAQQQADAVAKAYVNQVQTLTTATIERALQDTTERLEELQKANVDLSISPALPRLTAQVDNALPALQAASEKLRQMGATGPDTTAVEDTGIMLTASQLNTISQKVNARTSEATEIAALAQALKPVSEEEDFTERSSAIAVIESRARALATKLSSLSTEIAAAQQAETNPEVRDQLRTIEEQLQVASTTGEAILGPVVSLYTIQEQYIAASMATEPIQGQSLAKETDANLLQRIIKHASILTNTLDIASQYVQEIVPRTSDSARWRFTVLSTKIDSNISTLQEITQKLKLKPDLPEGNILLTRSELSMMEIQAQTILISLESVSSELTSVGTEELDPQVTADLLSVQEAVSIASNAVRGLGNEISSLATGEGDTSYTALDTLRQELQLALLSSDATGTRLVDTAVITSAGNLFARYRGVLLAVIAGLLLGAVGVLILRYFDRTVRDASQVRSQIGLPLLASIDAMYGKNLRSLSVWDDATPEYLESFRLLRTNLGLDSSQGKVLLVSSPQVGEGKTNVAVNLARAVALQGREVLLIDGNLHNPSVAGAFGLEEGEGLSELLSREDEEKDYLTEAEGVHILPSGKPSTVSAELLSSPRLTALLEKARKDYDIVIVDSAPVMRWTDTRILARNVDGVIMVLQNNASKLDLTKESKQALEAVGARTEGFVLNRTRP